MLPSNGNGSSVRKGSHTRSIAIAKLEAQLNDRCSRFAPSPSSPKRLSRERTKKPTVRFSMAEAWGMITLVTAAFAALMYIHHEPDCVGAMIFLAIPICGIVRDVIEFMQRSGQRGNRII